MSHKTQDLYAFLVFIILNKLELMHNNPGLII